MSREHEIVQQIEQLLGELKELLGSTSTTKRRVTKEHPGDNQSRRFSGLTKMIFGLVEDGYFDQPRKLSEIQSKLRDEGVNKPTTSLMRPLLTLIRQKVLARSKQPKGQYAYKKR
ncbi:hypothetical protein KQH82_08135 [bacterium]|nr:hypothetical protein [bacterium]